MERTENDYLRLWAEQLLLEHHRITWQHRVVLTTPLIEIGDAQGYWGKWWPARKTIVISARLIRQHPWEAVLNVFRHEMAHQLVSERHGQTRAHGDLFRAACERLGVPPEYRRASGALTEQEVLPDPTGRDRPRALLEKVRKLLALSESANEHEALLAMRKARELIDQHGLTTADSASEYCTLVINLGGKKIASHHRAIAAILVDHFQVEVVLATTFDAAACITCKCLDLIGRPGQVKVAEYIFHFLENRLESLWQRQRKNHPSRGRTGKNSYRLGVLKGFREKLAGTSAAGKSAVVANPAPTTIHLPVPQHNSGRDQFLAQRYPRLRSTKGRSITIDREHYQAGQEDGRRLELRAGLERSGNSPILPLPGRVKN
ncbi:MAG: DUF2786 domain-containing protein [Desulfobulbaceae bacterium]|nr:DUF2786 domain-containing protein [Desulfobulbaceae bacterium]